ncbi:hypothetical protein ACJIZ3_015355 [Penstemon smallii]|uniref:Uncharacterized protein n=1 Tax=Penstemon smallii TaxID=265156 RepID=A0ABD3RPJ5_9LAMI
MAVNDEITEHFVSTPGLDSTRSRLDGSVLTAEDIAWADSLLTKDPEPLDSGWNSFKDALFESINAQNDSSTSENDMIENPSSIVETVDLQDLDNTEAEEPKNERSLNFENADDFWSKYKKEDVFLPTYNEYLLDLESTDTSVDSVPLTYELSTEDIFKIWDLEIPPDEEDDLVKQFNKVLAGNAVEPDATKILKELKDVSLDDLVAGISDLSLSPT